MIPTDTGKDGVTQHEELAENCGDSYRQIRGDELPAKTGHKGNPSKVIHLKEEVMAFPSSLDNPEFKSAWQEWIAYRKEARLRPWIPRTVNAQLARLSEIGCTAAIVAIRASIAAGWQGIYPPRPGNGRQIAQGGAWFK